MTRIKFAGIILAAMPKPLLNALLILLLAVAVPLQGYAAASAGICRALVHPASHAVDAAEHGHHGDGHANTAEPEGHGLPDGSPAQDSHHCAACASCGVAAAISASPALYASDTPVWGVLIASFPEPKGHVPEGLDRPPLTPLV